MGKTYSFQEQLALGKGQEEALDNHFRKSGFTVVEKNDRFSQRRGIDRVFIGKNDKLWSVEYKADFSAGKTGNAFLEMIVDKKAGWVLTSEADYIMYLIVSTGNIYVISPDTLKNKLINYMNRLRWAEVYNEGYTAYGMLLPLTELNKISSKVLRLDA